MDKQDTPIGDYFLHFNGQYKIRLFSFLYFSGTEVYKIVIIKLFMGNMARTCIGQLYKNNMTH